MAKDPARAIKSAIILSKKITLNYGYCLGIDPWEAVWVTHKKKTPATLARQAKKDGNTAKTIFGQMTTELNIITLTCEKPPPGRVCYNIKYFLKEFGLKYKIRLIGPDGEVVEESDEDMSVEAGDVDAAEEEALAAEADEEDDDEEDGGDAQDAPAEDPNAAKWAAARAKIADKVAAADAGPRGQDVARLWHALNAKADGGDPLAALNGLPTLLKLIAPQPAKATLDPALVARFKAAAASMKDRIAQNPDKKPELMQHFAPARAALEGKNNDDLATALPPLEAAIKAAGATQAAPAPFDAALEARYKAAVARLRERITAHPEESRLMALFNPAKDALDAKDGPALAVALDRLEAALAEPVPVKDTPPDPAAIAADLTAIWKKARATTDAQLNQLLNRISGDGTDAGQDVAQVGLTRWAASANAEMDSVLKSLSAAPPTRCRAAIAATVEAIDAYENFLLMHPAVEVMEDNVHGVSVTLTSTLGGALQQMSARAAQG